MADSGKNAITTHDGDGTVGPFAIGFSFLDVDHITVTVGGSEVTTYDVDTGNTTITFDVGAEPPSGSGNIVFTRTTPKETLYVDFSNGAGLTETDLDNAILQALYRAAEVEDQI